MIQWPISQKVVSQRLVVIEKTSKEKNIVTSERTIEIVPIKTVREIEHRSSPGLRAQIPCFRWEFASTWILATTI